MDIDSLTHIDLTDGSQLYPNAGRWWQCYGDTATNRSADLGPILAEDTDIEDICSRLNVAGPAL